MANRLPLPALSETGDSSLLEGGEAAYVCCVEECRGELPMCSEVEGAIATGGSDAVEVY